MNYRAKGRIHDMRTKASKTKVPMRTSGPQENTGSRRNTGIRRLWQSEKRDQAVSDGADAVGQGMLDGIGQQAEIQRRLQMRANRDSGNANQRNMSNDAAATINTRVRNSIGSGPGGSGRTSGAGASASSRPTSRAQTRKRRGVVTVGPIPSGEG